jgi:acyl-[acyl-carrier-protein]-phospholipid O-acyltransferase/long-chain-fatty-acid--[acyl-carrier-protein] ligase
VSSYKKIKEHGYSELHVPSDVYPGYKIPVLSSGKIDYMAIERQLQEEEQSLAHSG